jgi:hypothetical protein
MYCRNYQETVKYVWFSLHIKFPDAGLIVLPAFYLVGKSRECDAGHTNPFTLPAHLPLLAPLWSEKLAG